MTAWGVAFAADALAGDDPFEEWCHHDFTLPRNVGGRAGEAVGPAVTAACADGAGLACAEGAGFAGAILWGVGMTFFGATGATAVGITFFAATGAGEAQGIAGTDGADD